MKLDAIQVAEFARHWGETYMLSKNGPVYVMNSDGAQATVLCSYAGDKKGKVPLQELELFNPETGYYNSVSTFEFPLAIFLSRRPTQQVSRGLSQRNADIAIPTFKDKAIVFNERSLSLQHEVMALYNQDYGKPYDRLQTLVKYQRQFNKPVFKMQRVSWDEGYNVGTKDTSGYYPSVALSKNIAAVKSKWGYLVLMFRKTPIGFYNEGKVYLNESASSYREQLEELRLGEFVWN